MSRPRRIPPPPTRFAPSPPGQPKPAPVPGRPVVPPPPPRYGAPASGLPGTVQRMKFGIKPFSLDAVYAVAKPATITGIALNPLTSRALAHIGGFTAQMDITYSGPGEHCGKIAEIVKYELDEGCLDGAAKDNGTKHADVTDSYGDPHGTALGFFFKGDGTSSLLQYWSNGDAPIPNSGYKIIRLIRKRGDNDYTLITRQYGAQVTIDGTTVAAGAGSVTCFQKITRASETAPPVLRLVSIW